MAIVNMGRGFSPVLLNTIYIKNSEGDGQNLNIKLNEI